MPLSSRTNLSADLAAQLRTLIVDGQIRADERLNEVHLAETLGVSRTPLREALMRLSAEGFVTSVPRRGFFVTPLSLAEFRQLYAIRAVLDPAALAEAGLPSAAQIEGLQQLNLAISASDDPAETIALDDRWHLLLLEHSPNTIMIDLIRQFMRRTCRYELAYMRESEHVGVVIEDHELILSACVRGDLESACDALRQNMQSANGPLLRWLEGRGAQRDTQRGAERKGGAQ